MRRKAAPAPAPGRPTISAPEGAAGAGGGPAEPGQVPAPDKTSTARPTERHAGGRPRAFIPDDKRKQVRLLAGFGMRVSEIAVVVGVPQRTLEKYCPAEIREGGAMVDSKVLASLFRIATGDTPQAVSAAIFWAKTRRRWHEVHRVIHGFDPGVVQEFVAQVVAAIRRRVPNACPHCKTDLELTRPLARELEAMSAKLAATLPPPELAPGPAADGDRG